jgi:predicted MFS family arabinose efflux permease
MVGATIVGNELAGPAIGGMLFAIGASIPFFTNASLLAGALLLLAGLPLLAPTDQTMADHESESETETEVRVGLWDGFPFLRQNPVLTMLTGASATLAAVDAAWFSLLVLLVEAKLGLGPGGFGTLLAVGAVGGLLGALVADRRPNQSLRSVAAVVFGSNAAVLILLGLRPGLATTVMALVVTSGGFALWNVHAVSTRQRLTPTDMLGRVGATYLTITVGAGIVGALLGGIAAQASSIEYTLVAGGATLAAAGAIVVGVQTWWKRSES